MTEVSVTARYVVDFVGGGSAVLEIGSEEDLDIALSEQITAYGDTQIDMIYPETGTPRIPQHGFRPEDYEA